MWAIGQLVPVRSIQLVPSFAVACVAAWSCSAPGPAGGSGVGGGAAVLIHGGRIHLSASGPTVDALAVRGGRVVAAGSIAEARAALAGADPAVVDLAGGVAVPGLQDAHGHVESFGRSLSSVELRDVASYAELVERVAARAAELPAGTWIQGRGWDHTRWPGDVFPHHAELSAAVPDHPVILSRVDGHAALVNAAALALAGLDGRIVDPRPVAGGEVLVGSDGLATGLLVDTAMGLVSRHVPEPDRAARRRSFLAAQDALLAAGLTCVHDMGLDVEAVEILDELRREGRLRLRIVGYLYGNELLPEPVRARFPLDLGGDGRLVVAGVKLMVDGALGSRGAALLADYSDRPGSVGLLRFEPEAFTELVRTYAADGLQVATHAIGDRANRMVLDAYEAVRASVEGFAERRPRIEHAQVVAPEDWPRFDSLGVVPSVQPTHATTDMRWAGDRLGPRRVQGAYAWRRLTGDPRTLALGSDFPVERPDPLEGLYAARTRQDRAGEPPGGFQPDQRLTAAEALSGFTAGAARAVHQEDRRGSLFVGYAADLTVLDVDPLECEPAELLAGQVRLTIVDGWVVYAAGP